MRSGLFRRPCPCPLPPAVCMAAVFVAAAAGAELVIIMEPIDDMAVVLTSIAVFWYQIKAKRGE